MGVWVLFNELVILMTCNILQCNDLLNWGFKYVFKCIFIVFIVFIFYVNMCLKMYLNMYQIFKTIIHLNILLVGNLNVCYECQALTFPILIMVIILYLSITIFFIIFLKVCSTLHILTEDGVQGAAVLRCFVCVFPYSVASLVFSEDRMCSALGNSTTGYKTPAELEQ